ncbi:hypothetical protein CK203_096259 [Vitis vinifera]|uniref:Conserved oligomeric Golgi complex subunit 1 n=1 Tax=Vitis vinifera TaxID=29760 RepID=A0A438FCH8_VITVI|nr:hypothetical protein CK203_096259 [Vitis vinifera]
MKFRCRFAPLEGAVAHCGPSKGWVLVGTVVQVSIPIIDQLGQGVPHSKPFLVVGDFKVIGIYGDFLSANDAGGSQVSEKGVLQVLLDLRFVADVLCGGDLNERRTEICCPSGAAHLVDILTPIAKSQVRSQAYLICSSRGMGCVSLVFLESATNSESNIMRCSTVPRFKYLPIRETLGFLRIRGDRKGCYGIYFISIPLDEPLVMLLLEEFLLVFYNSTGLCAPALSSRGTTKTSIPTSSDDASSRSPWKAYANGELSQKIDFDDTSSFGVATPLLKSFMQVGSRFGESTLKLGSIWTDGQVGKFKDKSAAAMSTFGDILPVQAAGLLSSLTATRSDSRLPTERF